MTAESQVLQSSPRDKNGIIGLDDPHSVDADLSCPMHCCMHCVHRSKAVDMRQKDDKKDATYQCLLLCMQHRITNAYTSTKVWTVCVQGAHAFVTGLLSKKGAATNQSE